MNEITVNGVTFYLTDYAVLALQGAKDGRQAEAAFERYADDVPRSHRGGVWQAVDGIHVPC